jgi:cupin 2 domain-containing protein
MPNVFSDLPDDLSKEFIETLAEGKNIRIERIVSHGQFSPDGFWYDQEQAEWIIVLRGEAKLLIVGAKEPVHLQVGDYLLIPARQRHRVEWTSPDEPTIWLAAFYD